MRRGKSTTPFSLFSFQDIITCVSGIVILITLMLVLELVQRSHNSPEFQSRAIASQLQSAIAAAQEEIVRYKSQLEADSTRLEELAGISADLIRREIFDTRSNVEVLEVEVDTLASQERRARTEDQRLQAELFDRKNDDQRRKEFQESTRRLEEQLEELNRTGQQIYNSTTPDGKLVWIVQVDSNRVLVARAGQRLRPEIFESQIWSRASNAFSSWLSSRSSQQDYFFVLVKPDGADQFDKVRDTLTEHGFAVGFDLLGSRESAVDPDVGAVLP